MKYSQFIIILIVTLFLSFSLSGCEVFRNNIESNYDDSKITITTSLPVIKSITNELFYNTNVSINYITEKQIDPAFYLEYPYNLHKKLNSDILLMSGNSDNWILELVDRDHFSDIIVLNSFSSPIGNHYNYWFDLDAVISYSNSILNLIRNDYHEFYLENEEQLNYNFENFKYKVNNIIDDNTELYYSDVISIKPSFIYLFSNFRMNNYGHLFNNIDYKISLKDIDDFFEIIKTQEISCLVNDNYFDKNIYNNLFNEINLKNKSINEIYLNLQPNINENYSSFIKREVTKLKECII